MMIKKNMVLGMLSFFLLSCSISKEIKEQRKTIDGTWTLENVSYEGSEGDFKAMLFNDADAFCFEGSTWFFRENNSTGTYTIQNSNSVCAGGGRNIRWSVVEGNSTNDKLQFKFIDEKKNDIYGRTGYRLDIVSLSPANMTLKSDVNVDGNTVSVVYNFNKK